MKPWGSRDSSPNASWSSCPSRETKPSCSSNENGRASARRALLTNSVVVADAIRGEPRERKEITELREGAIIRSPHARDELPEIEFNLNIAKPKRDGLSALHRRLEAHLICGLYGLFI